MAEQLKHLAVMQKVAGLNPARVKTEKLFTAHPAVNGYLTFVGEGLGDKR